MCVRNKYVYNKYLGRSVLVKCGKCPACLQEKACELANRIRTHSRPGFIQFFITLTYSNEYLPYIYKDDANEQFVPVYRNITRRNDFGRTVYDKSSQVVPIDYLYNDFFDTDIDCRKGLKCHKYSYNRVGVVYYKDIQDFFKRLRKYLKKHYGIEREAFTYFCTSELGERSFRPHYHIVLSIKSDYEKAVRDAVPSCWTFSVWNNKRKCIQVARDCASYVASYVNGNIDLPVLFTCRAFRPQHSSSKNYGLTQNVFSLASLLEKVKSRDLHYTVKVVQDGVPGISSVLFPKRVINRFFPKFKGYSLTTDDEIRRLLFRVDQLAFCVGSKSKFLEWSKSDIHQYKVLIGHCLQRFANVLSLSIDDAKEIYPFYFCDVWNLYKSISMKDSFDSVKSYKDFSDFYENPYMLTLPKFVSDLQDVCVNWYFNPNERPCVIEQTTRMVEYHHKYSKNRSIVSLALSSMDNEY